MHSIEQFYAAFARKDFRAMQECYADEAVFSDPVFPNLNAEQVRAMWEMLLSRSKDMQLRYGAVESAGNKGSASWTATYTFSGTGRQVVNHVKAVFVFNEAGKIVAHTDHFDFHRWASQALGWKGRLLGSTGFLRRKIQAAARKNLDAFMQQRP